MNNLNFVIVALFLFGTLMSIVFFKPSQRWKPLLVLSVVFYFLLVGSKLLVILYLALITFFFGILIGGQKLKVGWPIALVIIPLIVSNLIYSSNHFKNFQLESLNLIEVKNWSSVFNLLGLSYVSFNCISYLIDIHRRYIEPEKHFFKLLLYLTFFPTVFSGPLHRYKYLSRQFEQIEITNQSISGGLRLMLFGACKMMISHRLFRLVVSFENSDISGIYYLIVGTSFFLFLYFSFSALIDFVQGMALLLGITLKNNFNNRIYLSTSRQAFWKGWHITLNEWFRDYFFFPLAKKDKSRTYTDFFLLLTFLCIALWHGFTYGMIIWGFANGIWIIMEKKFKPKHDSNKVINKVLGLIYHLSISSLLALIFISSDFLGLLQRLSSYPAMPSQFVDQYGADILIILICILAVDYHNCKAKEQRFDVYLSHQKAIYRWAVYCKLILLLLIFGMHWNMDNYYNQF